MGEPSAVGAPEPGKNGKRPRWGALAATVAAYVSVVQGRAQWWNRGMKPQVDAAQSSAAQGADGAISAWVTDDCNRVLGQELSPGEEKQHAHLAHEGKLRELADLKKFDVYTKRNATRVMCRRKLRKPDSF